MVEDTAFPSFFLHMILLGSTVTNIITEGKRPEETPDCSTLKRVSYRKRKILRLSNLWSRISLEKWGTL